MTRKITHPDDCDFDVDDLELLRTAAESAGDLKLVQTIDDTNNGGGDTDPVWVANIAICETAIRVWRYSRAANMATQTVTLGEALAVARAGCNRLASAARRVDGIAAFGMLSAHDDGPLGQAYREIEEMLPADRDFSVDDWIAVTHERQEMPDAADVWRARRL